MGIETTSVERHTIRMTKHDGVMGSCLVGIETTSVDRHTIRMSCLVGIENLCRKTHDQNDKT